MVIQEIGARGLAFTFEDEITVYLIKGNEFYLLCDTHLGPKSMDIIKEYIAEHLPKKELLIFNSHGDWDHIWGNCAFKGSTIIAHEKTRAYIQEIGEFDLNRLKTFHQGEIELKLPNLTFSDKLSLADESIEFLYAPGHTIDSSLCFDKLDSVLFVGDLVEYPIPYLAYSNLDVFIKTLETIKHFPAKIKLSAHSGIVSEELIDRNLAYVKKVLSGQPVPTEMIGEGQEVHHYNLNNLLLLGYESEIKKKLGQDFDYAAYKSNFMDLGTMKFEDLKEGLEQYMRGLQK